MKKLSILIFVALCVFGCNAQSQKKYKEYEICTASEVYKGKKNHGKSYCVAWSTVREYKDGRKDTSGGWYTGKFFFGNEYGQYEKLSERGRYIIDSLDEDGIATLQDSYLSYESMYTKAGSKVEKFRQVRDTSIFIMEYIIWNKNGGFGYELKKEYKVK